VCHRTASADVELGAVVVNIVPDYDLDVMKDNQTPTQVTSGILAGQDPILQKEQPDWVLVQGDTATVTAAALAAFDARLKVGNIDIAQFSAERQLSWIIVHTVVFMTKEIQICLKNILAATPITKKSIGSLLLRTTRILQMHAYDLT